jgi:hypothetical protein
MTAANLCACGECGHARDAKSICSAASGQTERICPASHVEFVRVRCGGYGHRRNWLEHRGSGRPAIRSLTWPWRSFPPLAQKNAVPADYTSQPDTAENQILGDPPIHAWERNRLLRARWANVIGILPIRRPEVLYHLQRRCCKLFLVQFWYRLAVRPASNQFFFDAVRAFLPSRNGRRRVHESVCTAHQIQILRSNFV